MQHLKILQHHKQTIMEQSTLNFIYFLAVIGAIFLAIFLAKVLWSLVKMILPNKNYLERYGNNTWVIVTGGSDGIGLGFCEEFAALGFNICMIARNQEKIKKALQKIQNDLVLKIKTDYVVADFLKSGSPGFFGNIFESLKNKGILQNISILVNNVGISNMGYLHEITDQRLLDEITVNCIPIVLMSNNVVPHMLKRQKKSAIINVSSFTAQNPIPYVSNYSATKAFIDSFSKAIQLQYSSNIDVLSLRPMLVESNLSNKASSFSVATRNQCAKSAINMLGVDYETNGYWVHRLTSWAVGCLPTPILRGIGRAESKKLMQEQKKDKGGV